ncbi:DUF58 domain-containing protein [Agathobacter sp.]
MLKNRLGFSLLILLFLLLLIYLGNVYFLGATIVMIVVLVLLYFFINVDAGRMKVSIDAGGGAREGGQISAYVNISSARKLIVAQSVYLELEIENVMLGISMTRQLRLMLTDSGRPYDISNVASTCGELRVHVKKARVYDMFHIWNRAIAADSDTYTVVYPRQMDIQLIMSGETIGSNNDDGISQNKKGSDHSEMYDLKNYVPGDDVRSIHWKLSSKADELIIRESSNPSHYSVAILPDYGRQLFEKGEDIAKKYINTIIAAGASLGEELLRNGIFFCMAIPTDSGLELFEVQSQKDWMQVISMWMGFPIQSVPGEGLQFFRMEHMAQYFTRLIVLSAGRYDQNLNGLENELGVMLMESAQCREYEYTRLSGGIEMVSIPIDNEDKESYRIIC